MREIVELLRHQDPNVFRGLISQYIDKKLIELHTANITKINAVFNADKDAIRADDELGHNSLLAGLFNQILTQKLIAKGFLSANEAKNAAPSSAEGLEAKGQFDVLTREVINQLKKVSIPKWVATHRDQFVAMMEKNLVSDDRPPHESVRDNFQSFNATIQRYITLKLPEFYFWGIKLYFWKIKQLHSLMAELEKITKTYLKQVNPLLQSVRQQDSMIQQLGKTAIEKLQEMSSFMREYSECIAELQQAYREENDINLLERFQWAFSLLENAGKHKQRSLVEPMQAISNFIQQAQAFLKIAYPITKINNSGKEPVFQTATDHPVSPISVALDDELTLRYTVNHEKNGYLQRATLEIVLTDNVESILSSVEFYGEHFSNLCLFKSGRIILAVDGAAYVYQLKGLDNTLDSKPEIVLNNWFPLTEDLVSSPAEPLYVVNCNERNIAIIKPVFKTLKAADNATLELVYTVSLSVWDADSYECRIKNAKLNHATIPWAEKSPNQVFFQFAALPDGDTLFFWPQTVLGRSVACGVIDLKTLNCYVSRYGVNTDMVEPTSIDFNITPTGFIRYNGNPLLPSLIGEFRYPHITAFFNQPSAAPMHYTFLESIRPRLWQLPKDETRLEQVKDALLTAVRVNSLALIVMRYLDYGQLEKKFAYSRFFAEAEKPHAPTEALNAKPPSLRH